MKKYLLILFAILSFSTQAQHYENQMKFKKKEVVRTPRYRSDNNTDQVSQQEITEGLVDNQIILKCSALMNVEADSYLAIFNITQVATSAKEVDELINKRIQSFTENLKNIGVASSDVYLDMVYLIPVFEFEVSKKFFSKTYNEVPKGFEMQKNIHVKFNDPKLIDKIVTLAATNEIYDLVTVEYFIKDQSKIYDSLRSAANRFLRKNISSYKSLGVNLVEHFSTLSEETKEVYPESRYSDYEAFVSQSLEAARSTTVTILRKPKTVAYNKLAYDEFDIVINPEFTEPVVQFVYELTIKYILPPKSVEKNKYFIVDGNGNLKEILIK
jgi:uncharacterized protein YggE